MLKTLPKLIVGLFLSVNSFATANTVYHEFTMNTVGGGCGIFVNNLTPTNTDAVTIQFTIDYQLFTNQARIYYTTDGSTPDGAFGVPTGTTQVVNASYFCSYNNGTGVVDVAKGTIPALPTGTVVKYIVSAWHSSGGLEIFASGGTNSSASLATLFTYTVSSILPISITGFTAKKEKDVVKLSWSSARDINTSRYEIYSSNNGVDFKNIGTKMISGNLNNVNEYLFTDLNPMNGNNFYKIKVIDKTEHYSYTDIILIQFEKNRLLINISGRTLHVKCNSSQTENYIVAITNNSGQVLKRWNITGNPAAEYSLSLPQNIRESIYHITVKGNATRISQSVFIQ